MLMHIPRAFPVGGSWPTSFPLTASSWAQCSSPSFSSCTFIYNGHIIVGSINLLEPRLILWLAKIFSQIGDCCSYLLGWIFQSLRVWPDEGRGRPVRGEPAWIPRQHPAQQLRGLLGRHVDHSRQPRLLNVGFLIREALY